MVIEGILKIFRMKYYGNHIFHTKPRHIVVAIII